MKIAHSLGMIFFAFSFVACVTTQFETPEVLKGLPGPVSSTGAEDTVLRYIIIEKPIYIVSDTLITEEDIPMLDEVYASNAPENMVEEMVKKSTHNPDSKLVQWDRATMTYDYQEDTIYHIYCSPFRITDIQFKQGEKIIGTPVIGDSSYWIIESDEVRGEPHVYLKPTETNLETTLIINTSLKRYYMIIRSYDQKYMPMVRWNYPLDKLKKIGAIQTTTEMANEILSSTSNNTEMQPILLGNQMFHIYSFNYKMKTPLETPPWTPVRIYDDGEKTYIEFPQDISNHFSPVLHLVNKSKKELVNYRFQQTTMVVDNLITVAELSYEKIKVRISKNRESS